MSDDNVFHWFEINAALFIIRKTTYFERNYYFGLECVTFLLFYTVAAINYKFLEHLEHASLRFDG